MTDEQLKFLRAINRWQGCATPKDLRLPVDGKQDRARQKSRRDGLVTFEGGYWRLTSEGRAALLGARVGHVWGL